MDATRRRNLLTKIASLRSRVFFKADPLGTNIKMYLKTDKGKSVRVGTMSIDKDKKVSWSSLEPQFRGTGLGRLMYSRVLQRHGNLKGDKIQSGLAHGVYQSLPKPRRASSKKPLAMSAEKMREKGLEPERLVPTKTTLYQLPGETKRLYNRKTREGVTVNKPTVPLKIYRPGSKEAKEQAKRMIAAGEDPKNWTTRAQIERWKNATGSKMMERIRNPKFGPKKEKLIKARLQAAMSEKGLRPMKYDPRGGKRATKPSPVEVENTLKKLFPGDPKKAFGETEKIRRKGGYFLGLDTDIAGRAESIDRLSELRTKNPKDFGRPYGTVMRNANEEVRKRYAQQRAKEGNPLGPYEDTYPNLYNARMSNPKARSADHFYTEDRMSPRYQRKMRKKGKLAPSGSSGQNSPQTPRRTMTPSWSTLPPDDLRRMLQDLMGVSG